MQKILRTLLIIAFITATGWWHRPDKDVLLPEQKQTASIRLPDAGISQALRETLIARLPLFMQDAGNRLVTVIDFSLPSDTRRLWTFDPKTGELIFHSLVAHGRQSGENLAMFFSNRPNSHMSSLGFYLTGEPYEGKHGLSLRLRGLEPGINDNALERAIVVHGADYVSEQFVRQNGRLGRSQGCPAIPSDLAGRFIEATKGGSLLFVYHPEYHTLLAGQNKPEQKTERNNL